MSAQTQLEFISEEEYWAGEEVSQVKHEYLNGRVHAMAGGSYNHTTICNNVAAAAKVALKGRSCKSRNSEQRVKIESNGLNTYPDTVIFCPPARFEGTNDQTLLTPKVIFEVLSESTERYDRDQKFTYYKLINTLTDYVLVNQNRVTIDHYHRTEEGWLLRSYHWLNESLSFPELGIEFPLAEIYDELELPEGLPSIEDLPAETRQR